MALTNTQGRCYGDRRYRLASTKADAAQEGSGQRRPLGTGGTHLL